MLVYLIGFMGSGKTTVARKVATQLGWDLADLDKLIETKTGLSVEDIFRDKGEQFFRKIEAEALRNIDNTRNNVVACGGGTPCFYDNMDYMNKTGFTIYLKMSAGAIKNRLGESGSVRPLIKDMSDGELLGYINKTVKQREKWYSRAAVVTDGLNADISEIILAIQRRFPYNP
ncbi:MAG: shikimate kinase [Bacteroidales bacterium]|nr:shikimate kinase [Bacteroidales bacterium]